MDFITKHAVLYDFQFGFRRKCSTTLALIDVIDSIYDHLDMKQYVFGLCLDFEKAFDTLDHLVLLWKINYYGI